MIELISGKEALIAIGNGIDVEYRFKESDKWMPQNCLTIDGYLNNIAMFRIKPKTILLNGIEVPAPFEPKEGEKYWCFSTQTTLGYGHNVYESERADRRFINMGAWRTEEEIKQVVAALRKIFVINNQ